MGWADLVTANMYNRGGFDQRAPPPASELAARLRAVGAISQRAAQRRPAYGDIRATHEAIARTLARAVARRSARWCETEELAGALLMPRPFVEQTLARHGFDPALLASFVVVPVEFAAVRLARVVYGAPLLRCVSGGRAPRGAMSS